MHTLRRRGLTIGLFVSLLCSASQVGAAEQENRAALQATMRTFFQALATAFPLSLDLQKFQDPAQRPQITQALTTLAENAAGLESHIKNMPQSFDFLQRSLATSAQDALQRYTSGDFRSARFVLQHITENCFACHSRFTKPQQFNLGGHLLEETNLAALAPRERVRLAVAARQFPTALTMCETLLQDTSRGAGEIGFVGMLEDYLKLIMRVHGDFPRATMTVERVLKRPDLPSYMRERLADWLAALKELQPQGLQGEPLPRARSLVEEGQQRNRFPAYHQGMVHLVVASSLLHRYIDTRPADKQALAEAYYLLGAAEASISRTSWLSETPYFLETAIRLAPTSAIAARAYDALNAYILAEYTGSAGTEVPQKVQEFLNELRTLREQR
ncbi:MAG: hypothetical protein AB7N91_19505 [Candidatus Tectimicrobiota bacterium]